MILSAISGDLYLSLFEVICSEISLAFRAISWNLSAGISSRLSIFSSIMAEMVERLSESIASKPSLPSIIFLSVSWVADTSFVKSLVEIADASVISFILSLSKSSVVSVAITSTLSSSVIESKGFDAETIALICAPSTLADFLSLSISLELIASGFSAIKSSKVFVNRFDIELISSSTACVVTSGAFCLDIVLKALTDLVLLLMMTFAIDLYTSLLSAGIASIRLAMSAVACAAVTSFNGSALIRLVPTGRPRADTISSLALLIFAKPLLATFCSATIAISVVAGDAFVVIILLATSVFWATVFIFIVFTLSLPLIIPSAPLSWPPEEVITKVSGKSSTLTLKSPRLPSCLDVVVVAKTAPVFISTILTVAP